MSKVELGDIYNQGFVCKTYDPDTVILHRLHSLDVYPEKTKTNSLVGTELHYFIKDYYLSLWKKWGIFINNVTFTSRVLLPGSCVELHSDMSTSQYKAIIFCPEYDFKCDFVYGEREGKLNNFKPKFGDVIFCRTGSDRLVHGMTTLESQMPLIYLELYGGLDYKKPIEDQYYPGLEISKVELS